MQPDKLVTTASKPARLLPRAALIAALIAIFITTFFSNALPSLTPGGAELSATAKRVAVADHYRGKTSDYQVAASSWNGQGFH